jgi:hypothetical protein
MKRRLGWVVAAESKPTLPPRQNGDSWLERSEPRVARRWGVAVTVEATASPGADAFARAHAALLGERDLQFSMPAYAPPQVPEWLKGLGELLNAIAPIFPYILYGGLILGVAAILFFIARELIARRWPSLRNKKPAVLAEPEWRPAPERARTLLEDADRLAAEGRYGEAAHLILHRSVEDIDSRWPNLVRPALTSRDIADHPGLPELARRTFGNIARIVERNVFGGRALTADDFAICRQTYESFALPGVMA